VLRQSTNVPPVRETQAVDPFWGQPAIEQRLRVNGDRILMVDERFRALAWIARSEPTSAPSGGPLDHVGPFPLKLPGRQGGTTTPADGVFGPEIRAQLPAAAGQPGPRIARFIGVDGPRWFLRGVIAGEAAADPAAAAKIEDLFRSIVVVRGNTPMPPRDLIPLRMPAASSGGQPA
jgi:hypothetical protein